MSDDFYAIAKRVSNWGRWGRDDQRGTLNLVTPDVIKRAAASVIQGKLFRLGLDLGPDGPQPAGFRTGRFNPKLYMLHLSKPVNPDLPYFCVSDDIIHMPLQCCTQWDALSHVHYDGLLYNGVKASEALSVYGASKLGIENAADGLVSRGVLLDIPRLKNVDRLDPKTAITPDDLEAACVRQGVSVEAGDIVMIRTGHIAHFTEDKDAAAFQSDYQPGLAMECALWLRERNVAAVCSDNSGVERLGPDVRADPVAPLPLHMLCLRDMGLYLGEIFNLEALAEDCEQDGVYYCQLSSAPLPFKNAFGSPSNPIAIK